MVHNARQKFLVTTFGVAALIAALIIAAIAVPNWVMYSSGGDLPITQGLFKACQNGVCFDSTFTADGRGVLGNIRCVRNAGELEDRFRTTAATLIISIILVFVVLCYQFVHITGIANISEAKNMWLAWTMFFAFVSSLIGVALFGGTINSWWNCGVDICQSYKQAGTFCGAGYAYVFTIAGCAACLFCVVFITTYAKFPHVLYPTTDMLLAVMFFEIFSIVMTSIGLASSEWVVVVYNYASVGIFQNCTATQCTSPERPTISYTRTTSCAITDTAMSSRMSASAAMLILAAIVMVVIFVLFLLSYLRLLGRMTFTGVRKRVLIALLVISLVAQVIGFVLMTNIIDTFYFCGVSFCDTYTGFCRPGTSFGLTLASIVLSILLLGLHWFELKDWCCFEERFASGRQAFSFLKVLQGTKARRPGVAEPTDGADGSMSGSPTRDQNNPNNNSAGNNNGTNTQLPSGQWDFDTASGFYWSEELYLFYDPATMQYYDPNKDEWRASPQRAMMVEGGASTMKTPAAKSAGASSAARPTTPNTRGAR